MPGDEKRTSSTNNHCIIIIALIIIIIGWGKSYILISNRAMVSGRARYTPIEVFGSTLGFGVRLIGESFICFFTYENSFNRHDGGGGLVELRY